jgi:hypothetical protein
MEGPGMVRGQLSWDCYQASDRGNSCVPSPTCVSRLVLVIISELHHLSSKSPMPPRTWSACPSCTSPTNPHLCHDLDGTTRLGAGPPAAYLRRDTTATKHQVQQPNPPDAVGARPGYMATHMHVSMMISCQRPLKYAGSTALALSLCA